MSYFYVNFFVSLPLYCTLHTFQGEMGNQPALYVDFMLLSPSAETFGAYTGRKTRRRTSLIGIHKTLFPTCAVFSGCLISIKLFVVIYQLNYISFVRTAAENLSLVWLYR